MFLMCMVLLYISLLPLSVISEMNKVHKTKDNITKEVNNEE